MAVALPDPSGVCPACHQVASAAAIHGRIWVCALCGASNVETTPGVSRAAIGTDIETLDHDTLKALRKARGAVVPHGVPA
jgi:hypothetical protein